MPPQAVLYAENQALNAQVCGLRQQLEAAAFEVASLKVQIDYLKGKLFGGGQSEKLDRLQLQLKWEELEKLEASLPKPEKITKVSYERSAVREKRPLPAEIFAKLPVQETRTIIPQEVLARPEAFKQIGQESTFEIDVQPPKLVKREIVRPKFQEIADKAAAPVVAPAPARAVPGGYASAGLLAYIVIAKYLRHLPLYRLEQMSSEWGAQLPRQSMADWVRIAATWGEIIYKRMLEDLLTGKYIQADETPIRYCDPDARAGQTQQGYLWAISHPTGDVVFDWRLSRRHGELTTLIGADYQGLLQSDGYEAYASYASSRPHVQWLGCWAHARRKFFEAQAENPRLATAVLRLIARMYKREGEWDAQAIPAPERARRRQGPEGLARTMNALHKLAQRLLASKRVLPKSGLGRACTYILNQWEPLSAHLRHGESRLDNNRMENAIRPTAIGKKNWLFVGSPEAGNRAAVLYSLIVSCLRHGKDPHAYLRDILTRLPAMTTKDDLAPLLPKNWQPAS